VTVRIPRRGLVIGGVALAVGAVILVLILVVNGGGESEEDEIRDTVTQLFSAARAEELTTCGELLDPSSFEAWSAGEVGGGPFGPPDYCLSARKCMDNVIDELAITGDRATVTYVGTPANTDLVKVDGEWLVDASCNRL
jgi:hypothetical protein